MKIIFYLITSLLLINKCCGGIAIHPTKYDEQEEILIQGAPVILSKKNHSVAMYQTCETIEKKRANFFFEIGNNSCKNVNFYFDNLKVTDQFGRPIRVVHKKELISNANSKKRWKALGAALCTGLELNEADKAGRIEHYAQTATNSNSKFHACGSGGILNGLSSSSSYSSTSGTIQVEALRQQALRDVLQNAQCRDEAIQATFQHEESSLNNFYFDSTTVFPGSTYAANCQIEIDKSIENKLEYILFTFEFGGEEHTFCFHCTREGNKRRR